ncbi:MAG: tetratricopeptide repeat protein [Armatimonadota bacterium]
MEEKFQELIKKADQLVVNNDFEGALSFYLEADKISPNNSVVMRNIGNLSFKLGRFSEGVQGYIKYAAVLQNSGNTEEAGKVYKDIISFNPSSPNLSFVDKKILTSSPEEIGRAVLSFLSPAVINLASMYFQASSFEAAADVCKKALEVLPEEADIHMLLGRIYMQMNDVKSAVGEFQEVIRLSPHLSAPAYEFLGDILSAGGGKNEALSSYNNAVLFYKKYENSEKESEIYRKILALDSGNEKALAGLSESLIRSGKKQEALNIINELVSVYEKEGLIDKSILLYEKMLEMDKENHEIAEKLINIYKDILDRDPSNLSASHKLIARLIESGKIDEAVPIFINLATGYMQSNLTDEGINICRKVIEISSDTTEAYKILGELCLKKGDKEEAMSAYIKLFEIYKKDGRDQEAQEISEILNENFPKQSGMHYQLALSFFEKNQFDRAEKEIISALSADPSDLNSMKLYAGLLNTQNRKEDLVNVSQKILQLNPMDVSARERLVELYLGSGRIEDAVKESKYLGDVLCENKDYITSEKIFRNILSFFPDDIEVRERIASVLFNRNQVKEAKAELLNILDYDLKNEDTGHALEICRKIIKIDPQDFNAYNVLGDIARENGMFKEALSCFMFLADMYILNKMHHKAVEMITRVLKLSGKQTRYRAELIKLLVADNHMDLAKANYKVLIRDLIEEQKYDKAEKAAAELIELLQDDYKTRKDLAVIFIKNNLLNEGLNIMDELLDLLEKNGDYKQALNIIPPVLDLLYDGGFFDRYWELRTRRAHWYDKLGDKEKSVSEEFEIISGLLKQNMVKKAETLIAGFIKHSSSSAPGYLGKLMDLSRLLYDENLNEALIALLEPLSAHYFNNKDYDSLKPILNMLVSLYNEFGYSDKTYECYKKLAEVYLTLNDRENLIDTYFDIIGLFVSGKQYDKIDKYYKEIVKIKDTPQVKLKLADIYFNAENYLKVKELLEETGEYVNEDPGSLTKLVIACIKLNMFDSAVSYIKSAAFKGGLHAVIGEFRQAIKDNFSPGEQNLQVAGLYRDISFYEDAIFLLFNCAREDGSREIKRLIAGYLKEYGLVDMAVKQYLRIINEIEDEDDQIEVKYDLASLYEDTGRYKEALENYQDCYAIDIRYKDVAQKVERLGKKSR